jgi:acyl carrier protein
MGNLHGLLQQWVFAESEPGKDKTQKEIENRFIHKRPKVQSIYEAPQNETEKIVAEIWQELFGIDPIGVHDDFFELGGHSLLATKLVSRLREIFRIDLSLNTLFDKPTIREIVDNIIHTWGDREAVEEIAKTYREVFS